MIKPHGGKLTNRILTQKGVERIISGKIKKIEIRKDLVIDLRNIAMGVYSPLEGFLSRNDFQSVIKNNRLSNGIPWTIPIILDVNKDQAQKLKQGDKIILNYQKKNVGILELEEKYTFQKNKLAESVFGTLDRNHPGVDHVFEMREILLGGQIYLVNDYFKNVLPHLNLAPKQSREYFKSKNWNTIAGFQTRNVPHLGHEFLQKRALESVDGVFIQPVIGDKKLEDFKDEYILASYEVLINKYYPKNKVVLGILPLRMRYAGPREAIFHALIRKNFGCTHFIIGRDHAGVGKYYSPFAAQEIFNTFKPEEIGIQFFKYSEVIYCSSCQKHRFIHECSHPQEKKISFSGTKLRESIKNKEQPSSYIVRPEVYNLLAQSLNPLVDDMYKNINRRNQKGFVLWFTGLSCSGKTTMADRLYEILKEKGTGVERLDGDIVREYLSRDLGFSKEDRDENIKRVWFIAKLLSKNGIGVIASFISPYRAQRENMKKEAGNNFIEVFCNCPLEICEKRDRKGLYKKARIGKIENFTGISDPYEEPKNPEIELFTDKESIEECVNKVIAYLTENGFI